MNWFIISQLLVFSICRNLLLTKQFFTSEFTDIDVLTWTLKGTNLPSDHYFTSCNGQRIMGGFQVFSGDFIFPNSATKVWNNLPPHFSIMLTIKVYKIDSWVNETLFILADGITQKVFNWDNSTGTQDLCGKKNPLIDSINSNYNDISYMFNITFPHTSTSLNITIQSTLNSVNGAWGFRQFELIINACEQSCLNCLNQFSCTSCDSSVTDLALGIPFCQCSTTLTQKDPLCMSVPCVTCVPSCTAGFYPNGAYCSKCNKACSQCVGPQNTAAQCTSCAPGFYRTGVAMSCSMCYAGCSTCTGLTASSCTSCSNGYFYLAGSCLSKCYSGFFGSENNKMCYPCVNPCQTCNGGTSSYCLSCIAGFYLDQSKCLVNCTSGKYSYNWICLSQCPIATYLDLTISVCQNCPTLCMECVNGISCNYCVAGAVLYNGICSLNCPSNFYLLNGLCSSCHSSCLTCSGPNQNDCLSCDPSLHLYKQSCYSSCPSHTYSQICLSCSQLCLQCYGSTQKQCLSCYYPNFYQINTTSCQYQCDLGSIVDNQNYLCYKCSNGFVGYLGSCVSCSSTCRNCFGFQFFQCLECDSFAYLKYNTCIANNESNIVYTPNLSPSSSSILSLIVVLSATNILICVIIEFIFTYKTNLLPTIQLFQYLSYFFYLTIPIPQSLQKLYLTLYLSHPSSILPSVFTSMLPKHNISALMKLNSKIGYYIIDTLFANIILILTILTFWLIKLCQTYTKDKNIVIKKIYNNINPYLIGYTFRLILMEIIIAIAIDLKQFEINTILGGFSFGFIIIMCVVIVFSMFWKIRSKTDQGKQYGLLYFNQIGNIQQKNIYQQSQQQEQKGSTLIMCLPILQKIPIPLILVLFSTNSFTQSLSLLCYYILISFIHIFVPYRRKIYKYTIYFCNFILILVSLLMLLCQQEISVGYSIEIIILITIVGLLVITVMQLLTNWQYFYYFLKYIIKFIKQVLK